MKKITALLLLGVSLIVPSSYVLASPSKAVATDEAPFRLQIMHPRPLQQNRPNLITFRLSLVDTGAPVTLSMLKEVHTRKFHLLAIDPTLKDYHHIHPIPSKQPGEYTFSFIPHAQLGYRLWADITPIAQDQQHYVITDLDLKKPTVPLDRRLFQSSTVSGLHFVLTFNKVPKVNQPVMGEISILKDGKVLKTLEPVMGAYAHIAAFHEDFRTLMHIHPMGQAPTSAKAQGEGQLMFHMQPLKPGFVKLFVQIKVKGQDIFAPFAFEVMS
jgi:hypothetical protein